VARVAIETSSWPYRHDRDLTGFIDGTENRASPARPRSRLIPRRAGRGRLVLLLQRWAHDVEAWEALPVAAQQAAMGRTKDDSTELEPKPGNSHIARTDQDDFGHVFPAQHALRDRDRPRDDVRRLLRRQGPLARMLETWPGLDGPATS
jgi:putative iron-dependent peroxidase